MFRMPISRIEVELRDATGADDLLLLEDGDGCLISTSMKLARRLAVTRHCGELDAGALPIADLEALLLELRRRVLGDVVATRGCCPDPECATPIDISFRVSDYLRSYSARKPANVEPLESEPDWFRLRDSGSQFRLVTAADLAASVASNHPEHELARRTIRSHSSGRREFRREERAMQALAPPFSGEIQGHCPECGAAVRFWFDVQSYVLQELRYEAQFLYEDVHQLASRYHWSEETILSLPRRRRAQYVEMALRQDGES
jgi:hypothetical protein